MSSSQPPAPAPQRTGILFVVSAPSGAGKTTLCKELVDIFPELGQSVSFTTRPPRTGEMDGRDYHFVSDAQFDAMVGQGEFAEWAVVHGNRYGTALATLEQAYLQGRDLLLDIDCQGARQLREKVAQAVFIFILPPNAEELESRLRNRQTDSDAVISRRLGNARQEIEQAVWYDYLVVNDAVAAASRKLQAIVLAERCRTRRMRDKPIELFARPGRSD